MDNAFTESDFTDYFETINKDHLDVPISLGVLLALGMSVAETASHATHTYFDSAMMLLFFLLCGRALDHAMRRKTRARRRGLPR